MNQSIVKNGTIANTSFTDKSSIQGTTAVAIKAVHITELQKAVTSLQTYATHVENCGNCTYCQKTTCQSTTCQTTSCQSCQSSTCQTQTCQSCQACQYCQYTPCSCYSCYSCCCLLNGTTVICLCDNEYIRKDIKDVKIGDLLLGGGGVFNTVTNVIKGKYHNEVAIYGFEHSDIRVTGHHHIPFNKNGKLQWGVFDYEYYKQRHEITDNQGLTIAQHEFIENNPNADVRIAPKAVKMSLDELFITLNGWEMRKSYIVPAKENETLYTIQTDGNHTIFAGGILVGAGSDVRTDYAHMPVKKIGV